MDNNMIEKLKSMLDDPETVKALSDTISGIMPQTSDATAKHSTDSPADYDEYVVEEPSSDGAQSGRIMPQPDVFSSLKDTLAKSGNTQDPRINLLYSLKPYLRPSRSAKMDQAIKLIQITKIASLLK